ncbi:TPM domain-containing protein [Hwangdonia lutea]|uniref:TPM domain-containing protein n=1 Tax=Hwangdonia lutea TaxID=3075823 RepID=A0AA97EPN8_9FLAO|nr:TPM domain-containing protein [Hwangdonia sp. SCSIO 19198]WOD45254.1 TPM domain-containing protein [Hwangdonia sp. SCSIO 19198]
MKKKILIITGSIGVLYMLLAFVLPKFVAAPFAAHQSKNVWTENEKDYSESKSSNLVLDSIGNFPLPMGYVSDFEKIFSERQISHLTKIITDYEQKTTREIAIVTISSIEPYGNMKDYSTDLANEWKIGKPEKDNGLIILFSKNLRQIRIATGTGTEQKLTDEICKSVLDNTIIPEFKKGHYYSGIESGLNQLILLWE